MSYLHQITVRLNTLKLQIFEIDPKGLGLLLHEGNDTMKSLDIPVVESLRGSIALLRPLRYCGQRMLFDEPSQVEEVVLKCLLVFHPWISLSCSIPRMTSANSWLRVRSCCQCRRSPC
jgi:hypothetical protein